jgi:hypothetical protein
MWPYIRSEIVKTYVDAPVLEAIYKTGAIQRNFFHEIAYTSHELPKRILLGNGGDTNPYHLFFYMLSRFYYFDNGEQILYYYPNENNYLVEKALQSLPVRFKRELIKTPGYEYFEMPGCAWYPDSIDEPWIYSYVRDLFKEIWNSTPQEKGKFTYISRNKRNISSRRCLNEDELVKPLKEIGFSTYTLETLTFEQQIKLFRSSQIITGLHGAGFAWLIFCFPGTIFIEIQNPHCNISKGHYKDISLKNNLTYIRFQEVRQPLPNEYDSPEAEDCIVDKDKYIVTLKTISELIL